MRQRYRVMPKVLFFSDPSNGRPPRAFRALGATIRLDSGEPCSMSIAPGWVWVKKSRFGLFGRTLYNVRNVHKTAETAKSLTYLYPDSLLPTGFTDPTLCAFANAILHCATCNDVATVLNEAVTRADEQAKRDVEIISDWGNLMEDRTIRPDAFYDVSVLPHPKEAIIAAIERQILWVPNQELVELLITASLFLWNFLHGVGSAPLPLLGEDLGPAHGGEMTPEALDELRREAERIVTNPNRQRAEQFRAIADREAKLIDSRIAAAVRLRSVWRS
jgi:hypothetical protein